ncbi:MAG: NAD(P)/FAD-dependent oxidoreductase [Desulfuromonadales bacterium]|nr:NAD(P)/FAD-dependent oxidoreductase [Desulfuromonadales bacterium]
MNYDFAVIGGGIAGLTAALILARRGLRVALVEKGERTATLVRGFERRGLRFDTGFHYAGGLAPGDILDRFCQYLGIAEKLSPQPLNADAYDTLRCLQPEFEFRFPSGREPLRQRLHATFPREGGAIDAYLLEIDRAVAAFPYMSLEAAQPPELAESPTLQQVLDRLTGDRRLQMVLSIHTFLHGVAPAQIPFPLHAMVVGPYYRTAHTLQGGGASLADAFDGELARLGVDTFCGEGVEAILLASDRVSGLRLTGGRTLACNGCIATLHPRQLLDLVPDPVFRPAYRRRLHSLEETPSACFRFGAGPEPPSGLGDGNFFLLPTVEACSRLEEMDLAPGPLYVTGAPSIKSGCQPGGYLSIFPIGTRMLGPARKGDGRRDAAYTLEKGRLEQKMRDKMLLFFPQWGDDWSEAATPHTLCDYGHSPAGSLYGVKHRVGQTNPQARTRLPGLWLAGQATAAPGVLGAIISAFLACGEIVGHEKLRQELQACR